MVAEEAKLSLGSVSDINLDLIEDTDLGENEEFYEKIEAPKFVDFTVPNHYGPDDRYWFCLRVGCEQKHEEEMDSETIYKNFVLRVMAARSPNVRLHKALHRKDSSKNSKSPLSAPPKPYKSMLPRLAVVSSLSKRIIGDEIVKAKPHAKVVSSTPKAKGKQVSSKYLTTPSYKKCPPNPRSFQSVGKPKSPTLLPPKSRIIAKTLTFQTSPRTTLNLKKSLAPVANSCEESEKNLEKKSQRNRVLGYSSKTTSNPNNSQKLTMTTQKDYNLDKLRNKKSVLRSRTRNDHNAKSSRPIKHNKEDKPTNGCIEAAKDACVVPLTTENIHAVSMNAADTVCNDNPRLPISSKENDRIEENEKENASTFDDNRSVNNISNQTVIEVLAVKNSEGKKGTLNANKNLKGSATGMKALKPKITNPKPFRLLTDERRIMKGKNSDGRKHEVLLPKEVSINSRHKDEDCTGQQGGDIQKGGCRRIASSKTPEHRHMVTKTPNSVKSNNSNHKDLKPVTSSAAHQTNPRRDLKNVLRKSTFSSRMHAIGSNLTPAKHFSSVGKEIAHE